MDYREASSKPKYMRPLEGIFSKNKVIGIIDPCYGSSHVIYPLELEGVTHKRMLKLPLERLDSKSTFNEFTPIVFGFSADILHTWNAIPRNGNFIVSFELEMPRYLGETNDSELFKGLEILSSKRCKAIAALSEFAASNARKFFAEKGYANLNEKLCVLRGTVPDPQEKYNIKPQRSNQDKITAVVIGTQLFRKGGMYAIQAFEQLRNEGIEVELTLIGKFETSSYVFGEHLPDSDYWTEKAKSCDWIKLLPPVPNRQVFEELANHDICLYPSVDESLGWLPIEASMLGVPVIACNIGAFPEFVKDGVTGFLIDVPLSDNRRWTGLQESPTKKAKLLEELNSLIVKGIVDSINKFSKDRSKISLFGEQARSMIQPIYGKDFYAQELTKLYKNHL